MLKTIVTVNPIHVIGYGRLLQPNRIAFQDSHNVIVLLKKNGSVTFTPLPPPRQPLEPVSVQFTKLETDHLPAREHREEEIRIYKKTNNIGQSTEQNDGQGLAERQPAFLKDKGDALYEQDNYR